MVSARTNAVEGVRRVSTNTYCKSGACLLCVKSGKARNEHLLSAIRRKAEKLGRFAMSAPCQHQKFASHSMTGSRVSVEGAEINRAELPTL
jgi:hypothetical protein